MTDLVPIVSDCVVSDPLPDLPSGLAYGWGDPDDDDEASLWLRFDSRDVLAIRVLSAVPLRYWGHWYPAARAYRLCQAKRDRRGNVLLSHLCPYCPRPMSELKSPSNPAGKPIASAGRLRHILTVELLDGRQRLWEFSDTVARQLRTLLGEEADVGGVCLLLNRVPPRLNGALIVQLDPDPAPRGAMPDPIDAVAYVTEGWRRAAQRDGKAAPTLPFG